MPLEREAENNNIENVYVKKMNSLKGQEECYIR